MIGGMMVKLNVGCGNDYREGYFNIDYFYQGPIDVYNDIVTLPSFSDNVADEILASHVLEHLGYYGGIKAAKRWFDVLKPGGVIEIIVPNFPLMAAMWLDAYNRKDGTVWGFHSMTIWGNQGHEGEFHTWGYDNSTLHFLLTKQGFIDIDIQYIDGKWEGDKIVTNGNIRATARKPE